MHIKIGPSIRKTDKYPISEKTNADADRNRSALENYSSGFYSSSYIYFSGVK